MRYALIGDTGKPFGPYCSPNEAEAVKNRPDLDNPPVIELPEEIPDDLSGLWGRSTDGVWELVARDQVSDQAALDAMAAEEAEEAKAQTLVDLAATDQPLIRALEDLIKALLAKGTIADKDLPQAVLDKLQARKDLRAKLNA